MKQLREFWNDLKLIRLAFWLIIAGIFVFELSLVVIVTSAVKDSIERRKDSIPGMIIDEHTKSVADRPPLVYLTTEHQWFPVGTVLTSEESGKLIPAGPYTPDYLIVGIVTDSGIDVGWYKDGFYWRKPSPDWEWEVYSAPVDSKGDLIFNTCYRNLTEGDTTEWADSSLQYCEFLLLKWKRWPDRMNQPFDARTRIRSWTDKLFYKLGLIEQMKYRSQNDMTRDLYTAFFTNCVILDQADRIERVRVPWYLYRPGMTAWRKFLITRNAKYERRYLFWDKFTHSKKHYVIRLRELQHLAIETLKN